MARSQITTSYVPQTPAGKDIGNTGDPKLEDALFRELQYNIKSLMVTHISWRPNDQQAKVTPKDIAVMMMSHPQLAWDIFTALKYLQTERNHNGHNNPPLKVKEYPQGTEARREAWEVRINDAKRTKT